MPADYDVAVRTSHTWQAVDAVRNNVVLGPRVKLHLLEDVRADGLRVRILQPVRRRPARQKAQTRAELSLCAGWRRMPRIGYRHISSHFWIGTPRVW